MRYYGQQRSAIVTVLASKIDPEAELKYMQDLFEHSFLHRELNVKYNSAERVLESVKRTGHNTGYATNWTSYLSVSKHCWMNELMNLSGLWFHHLLKN